MIDYLQVPTLYAFAVAGIICGVAALVVSFITYKTAKRNCRVLKSLVQGMELLLAGQDKDTAERAKMRGFLEKTLRELEHDHDKFKDTLEGYAQTLNRIEGISRKVKDNQAEYIKNTSSSNNKIKINTPVPPHTPEAYESQLLNTLLRQLVDRAQDNRNPPPTEQLDENSQCQPPPLKSN